MKNLIILITLSIISFKGYSATITAVSNGPWTNGTTWSSGSTPSNGDAVIIPSGITVVINSNMNIGSTNFYVQVYGILQFVGGGAKLTIGASSTIFIYAGGEIMGTGNPSETITIGGNQVYNANTQNIVTGSSTANSSSPGFIPFIPLPIQFVSFSIVVESNNRVLVQWATAQEQNSSHFDIERSVDGNKWNSIAKVSAAGNSSNITTYSYDDILISSSTIYYRIKEVDKDGKYSYTATKVIQGGSLAASKVQVSTSYHSLIVQFPQAVIGNVLVRIISFSGQVISQVTVNQPQGQVVLNADASLRGNYIISLTNNKDFSFSKQIQL